MWSRMRCFDTAQAKVPAAKAGHPAAVRQQRITYGCGRPPASGQSSVVLIIFSSQGKVTRCMSFFMLQEGGGLGWGADWLS